MATITAANSIFTLAITNLYPSPQTLEGYGADDAFTTEAIEMVETTMGIDGKLSGGFVFTPVNTPITLMPDSRSVDLFDSWVTAMKTTREVFTANATIDLPAVRKKYTLTKGYLVNATIIPGVRKTLQPEQFIIRWEKVTVENY